ncbi:MAG TPA: Lsr2 family protein [Actinocrinis sp.]|nr:Lsr2 family protein [Actinocrinis sp.]
MAQHVQTVLVDDIDGSEAQETVKFSLDGTEFEIDLTEAHAAELRDALAKFVDAGRKLGKSSQAVTAKRTGRKSAAPNNAPDPAEVREWAKAQGIEVSNRGRVANELVLKFQSAKG